MGADPNGRLTRAPKGPAAKGVAAWLWDGIVPASSGVDELATGHMLESVVIFDVRI